MKWLDILPKHLMQKVVRHLHFQLARVLPVLVEPFLSLLLMLLYCSGKPPINMKAIQKLVFKRRNADVERIKQFPSTPWGISEHFEDTVVAAPGPVAQIHMHVTVEGPGGMHLAALM